MRGYKLECKPSGLLQIGVQTFRFARLSWGKPKGLHSRKV